MKRWTLTKVSGEEVATALAELLSLAPDAPAPFTVEGREDGSVVVTAWGEATQAIESVLRDQARRSQLATSRQPPMPSLRERLLTLQRSSNPEIRVLASILLVFLR